MDDIDAIDYTTPEGKRARWIIEIDEAEKWAKPWLDRSVKVLRRYRDGHIDQDLAPRGKKLNIFWSNVETLKPAVYARRPKPVVERRYKDDDPVARMASEVLERAATYSVDDDQFDELMRQCRDDYLIVGRGTAWVRYVPHFAKMQPATPSDGVSVTDDTAEYESDDAAPVEAAQTEAEEIAYEEVAADYVAWKDFIISPARTWREVRWVARRVQMTREELVERFGEKGRDVTLDARNTTKGETETAESRVRDEIVCRANVYEVWNKATREVCWLAKGYEPGLLDERADPLRLREFFPCPRPMFATLTTDLLLPIADFVLYQDQADELDDITDRLSRMIAACQNKGVYDASQDASLARIMDEGNDNQLIPVNSWAAFSQAGGLKGVMDFVPLEPTIAAIQQLTLRSQAVKADIYEITGISDIIRGYSDAAETATAQQIKGQFAALRLKDRQGEVARFSRDLVALTAEIISEHFQPQTIALMADVQSMTQEMQQQFPQAIQLLKNDAMRNFRVEIETDSTVQIDEQADKQAAVEFMKVMGEFLGAALPVAQQAPLLLPMFKEDALFLARRYRAGRSLEASIEQGFDALIQQAQQAAQAGPKPDPAMIKAEADAKGVEMKTQAHVQSVGMKTQAQIQADQMKLQAGLQMDAAKLQGQQALDEYKALSAPAEGSA